MWKPQKVLKSVSWQSKPWQVEAYVYKGLALRIEINGSPKGRRKPTWSLMHIGSGHNVCLITGTAADVFPVAAEIADECDWSFGGLSGWKNQDPELPKKVIAWMKRHPITSRLHGQQNEGQASQIAKAMS